MMDSITIEPSTYTKSLYAPAENVFFNVTYKKPFWTDKSFNSIKDIITTWDFGNNLNFVHDTSHEHNNKVVLTGFLAESHFTQTRRKCLFATLDDCYKSTNASNYLRYKEYDPSLVNDQVMFGCPMSTLRPTSFDDHLHKEESYDRWAWKFIRIFHIVFQSFNRFELPSIKGSYLPRANTLKIGPAR